MSSLSTPAHSILLAALLLLGAAAPAGAQERPLETTLEGLVQEALAANLEVSGADATVAQRLAALDQARALYLPAVDLGIRYSRADGGRSIDIPVGDLLNPVYSTLNQLLAAHGQPAPFTPIANQSFQLMRPEEQQTSLLLTQPVYDARIPAANRAASSEHLAALGGLDAVRGRIARDMKQAYLRWLGVAEAVRILDATLELTRENQRVNESLFRNGRITRDLVYRAQADVLEIEQQRLAATNALDLARGYVNLLRNRPLDSALPSAPVVPGDIDASRSRVARAANSPALALPALQDTAASRRPELRQLDAAISAAGAGEDAARAAYRPRLSLAVDAGSQSVDFAYGTDEQYVFASLVLRFNLFNGGADAAALREARSRSDEFRAARALAEQRVRLETQEALQLWQVAEASLQTAAKRVEAADGAFRIASKKRDLGQINQAEFIDARRAYSDAALNLNRVRFEALSALASIEYATGAPPSAATRKESP
jgi:outer membrane protein TolC